MLRFGILAGSLAYLAQDLLSLIPLSCRESTLSVIVVKLRSAMERYRHRTGQRLTYDKLAERTGLSRATIVSIATRADYNTTLATIEKLCEALDCQPGDLLEILPEPPADTEA